MPIDHPTFPGFVNRTFTGISAVARQESPFTGQETVYEWSAQVTSVGLSLPSMEPSVAVRWDAFFKRINNSGDTFWVYAPDYLCNGHNIGNPVLDGASQNGNTINVRGCLANMFEAFGAGKFIEVCGRLHVVSDDVDTDSNGRAVVPIWPAVQMLNLPDGTIVQFERPRGEFRLASSEVSFTYGLSKLSEPITIAAREVVRR